LIPNGAKVADSQSRYSEQEKLPGASSARVSFEKTILKKVYVVFFLFSNKNENRNRKKSKHQTLEGKNYLA
jgi:hypothetical protein